LIQVAQVLTQSVRRTTDLVARYGGEEFALILPNTDADGARHIANLIQYQLQRLNIEHTQSPKGFVSLSMGIGCTIPMLENSPEQLIKIADQGLYNAKEQGRNRIVLKELK